MEFTPLSDRQLREMNLYPEGRYRFQVLRTNQKHSANSGNDYFNLKMRIWVEGKERILFDMLFFEGKMLYKTKHFCDATDMSDIYESGKINPVDCDGKEGYLDLVHRANNQTGELQNSVKDYIVPEESIVSPAELADMAKQHVAQNPNSQNTNGFNDEISF